MSGGTEGLDSKRTAALSKQDELDRRELALDAWKAQLAKRERALDEAIRKQDDIREANEHLVLATLAAEHQEETARRTKKQQDEFIAMLAHELRNPLAPIRSAGALLESFSSLDARIGTISGVVGRQVAHMARLLDDLLDASRVTSGRVTLQRRSTSVEEFVSAGVEATEPLIHSRQQTLNVELPSNPIYIDGDPARLAQVLGNLLHNASKYTPENGLITLSARRDGATAVLTVADNGSGISKEALPGIFDLFTQEERALSRSQGGLGLGLTVVRSMVELHGGRISADSDGIGRGSVFTLVLPCIEGRPEEATRQTTSSQFLPARVLVVDDNQDAADMLAMLLQATGYEVKVANDGEAAIAAFVRHRPQIVLCDIGLPGMDGYEIAARMRQSSPDQVPKALLVALTGYDSPADRAKTLASDFDHHLSKPADIDTILTLISGHLHGAAG